MKERGLFLYQLLALSSFFVGSTEVCDSSLWHKRLDHPSNFMIGKLLGKSSLANKKSINLCSIYLQVKQTRDIFPLSLNNAKEIFDLIHGDLWGP